MSLNNCLIYRNLIKKFLQSTRTVMTTGSESVWMFSSVWQQVMNDMLVIVQNCSEQCVVKKIIVSKLWCSISVLTLDWFSRTPRRTNASIRSLSAEVVKPHQWNVKESTAFPRTTVNCRGLAILNVCILILIMTTTEVTVGLQCSIVSRW